MQAAEDRLAVRFWEETTHKDRLTAAARKPEIGDIETRYEVPSEKFTVLDVAPGRAREAERLDAAVAAMDSDPTVQRCAPVFRLGEALTIAPNRLLVGFHSLKKKAKRILAAHGCKKVRRFGKEYLVEIDPGDDPFVVAAVLDAVPEVAYAEPDFVNFGTYLEPLSPGPGPTDPLAPDQWALRTTRTEDAWALQKGDPKTKIAVLDLGVDADHIDLAAAITDPNDLFDAVEDDKFPEPNPWDSHGTACAGLAVAVHDNDTGMKGVAGGCSLMAGRIAYSNRRGGNWKTSDAWIARAIDWAWKNGADVISNSWRAPESSAITNAIVRAKTKGRKGRGAAVVVAAGNSDRACDYPANLKRACDYPANLKEVLTVAASNQDDEPKTPDSGDGDTDWGSSFGPNVDVAAPGIQNFTTDIMGQDGYNQAPSPEGNYNPRFRGTSSSTPIVAGAIGLVLSANPKLTESQVCALIKGTADKVGGIAYDEGRNDRMGHGRLNVLRAVRAALDGNVPDIPVDDPAVEPVEGPEDDQDDAPVEVPPEEPVEIELVIPTGKHAPVGNMDADTERDARELLTYPPFRGEAESDFQKTRKGEEVVAVGAAAELGAGALEAPDTAGLKNIAEASYGPSPDVSASVHGPDDRSRIERTDDYPWRAHASLLITAKDGSRWRGMGWFVGPRTLVTAGHAVFVRNHDNPDVDGWVTRIVVMPGRDGARLPFGSVTSECYHSVAGWTEDGDHCYDYGAITIPTPLGETVGTLGFGVFNKDDLHRVIGNIAGYPVDKPDGTLWYSKNRVETVSSSKVFFDADTVGGQSGAAAYRIDADGRRRAFGIQSFGAGRSNAAVRITTPVYHNFRNWMRG